MTFILNNKDRAKELIEKGLALNNLNKYIECYDKAIQLNPNDAEAFNNKGFAMNNLNKYNLVDSLKLDFF